MNEMNEMNNLYKVAVASAVASKEVTAAKKTLEQKEAWDVDLLVRVSGSIKKGEDSMRTPTVSIPFKTALALFVHRCGVTRDTALELLLDVMNQALTVKGDAAEELLKVSGVQEAYETLSFQTLAKMKKVPKTGTVTTKLNAEVVANNSKEVCELLGVDNNLTEE